MLCSRQMQSPFSRRSLFFPSTSPARKDSAPHTTEADNPTSQENNYMQSHLPHAVHTRARRRRQQRARAVPSRARMRCTHAKSLCLRRPSSSLCSHTARIAASVVGATTPRQQQQQQYAKQVQSLMDAVNYCKLSSTSSSSSPRRRLCLRASLCDAATSSRRRQRSHHNDVESP